MFTANPNKIKEYNLTASIKNPDVSDEFVLDLERGKTLHTINLSNIKLSNKCTK